MATFRIVIPVYEGVNLLDVCAPREMFHWVPGWDKETLTVAATNDPVTTVDGQGLVPHATFDDIDGADLLWVPGGNPVDLLAQMRDPAMQGFLKRIGADATLVCSVCEGALIAAAAGLLEGHTVTTHWGFKACLEQFPGVTVADGFPRFVVSGNRVTGGGISSELDEALGVIELIAGTAAAEAVQRTTQYSPNPPVSAGPPVDVPCSMGQVGPIPR